MDSLNIILEEYYKTQSPVDSFEKLLILYKNKKALRNEAL